jgi:excisionase family DNA binding protein
MQLLVRAMDTKYLTEREVAERMRCSTSKVKRLRFTGGLPYIPGRPVLISEADLEEFLNARKLRLDAPKLPEKAPVSESKYPRLNDKQIALLEKRKFRAMVQASRSR